LEAVAAILTGNLNCLLLSLAESVAVIKEDRGFTHSWPHWFRESIFPERNRRTGQIPTGRPTTATRHFTAFSWSSYYTPVNLCRIAA
jgi:hypothetical protein